MAFLFVYFRPISETILWPVKYSMAIRIKKPAMAARPLSCSAYSLNPFLGRSSLGLMEGLISVTVLKLRYTYLFSLSKGEFVNQFYPMSHPGLRLLLHRYRNAKLGLAGDFEALALKLYKIKNRLAWRCLCRLVYRKKLKI